jgi:hypothetical protein
VILRPSRRPLIRPSGTFSPRGEGGRSAGYSPLPTGERVAERSGGGVRAPGEKPFVADSDFRVVTPIDGLAAHAARSSHTFTSSTIAFTEVSMS